MANEEWPHCLEQQMLQKPMPSPEGFMNLLLYWLHLECAVCT